MRARQAQHVLTTTRPSSHVNSSWDSGEPICSTWLRNWASRTCSTKALSRPTRSLHVSARIATRCIASCAHLPNSVCSPKHRTDGFSLTPLGDCLRTDRPGSLRPLARFWGHEMMQRAWGSLLHTIMTGETAFDHALGMSAFAYLQSHPDAAAIYHDGMAKIQVLETNAVIDAYEFPRCGTIVDVGGGNGSLLAAVLQTVPATGGVVFDLPNAQSDVEATIRTAGLTDRVRFEPGDFFTEVTADGDCYLLRQIIHDWEDDDAMTILRTCRRAIAPDGRLLIIELILPPEGADSLEAVMIDVTMLVRLGGRERTEAQYATLLEKAGFNLDRVLTTAGRQAILECTPAWQSGYY